MLLIDARQLGDGRCFADAVHADNQHDARSANSGVGTGMLGTPGIAARMFRALAEGGINIEMISTSEIRITCLVARDQVDKGVRILHKAFELDQEII